MQWWADWWDSVARFFGYDVWLWGTAADWVGAIGTTGALFLALLVIGREQINSRRAIADRVAVRIDERWSEELESGTGRSMLEVTNHNEVGFPFVEVFWRLHKPRAKPRAFATHAATDGEDMSAGERIVEVVDMPHAPGSSLIMVAELCDPNGRKWYRDVIKDRYISKRKFRRFAYGTDLRWQKDRLYLNP
jgi:hypothetical protein